MHFQARLVMNRCKLSVWMVVSCRRRRSSGILSQSLQGPPTAAGVTAVTGALLLLCESSSPAWENGRADRGCTSNQNPDCHFRYG